MSENYHLARLKGVCGESFIQRSLEATAARGSDSWMRRLIEKEWGSAIDGCCAHHRICSVCQNQEPAGSHIKPLLHMKRKMEWQLKRPMKKLVPPHKHRYFRSGQIMFFLILFLYSVLTLYSVNYVVRILIIFCACRRTKSVQTQKSVLSSNNRNRNTSRGHRGQ